MALQLNVQQQAAVTTAKIKSAASLGATMPEWLCSALQQNSLSAQAGLLVQYREIPEQEGDLQAGIWLTESLEFWEFAVMVARDHKHALTIEEFLNATGKYPSIASLPGTGPSFGYLARQVLRELRDA